MLAKKSKSLKVLPQSYRKVNEGSCVPKFVRFCLICLIGLASVQNSLAAKAYAGKNCVLHIHSEYKSGEVRDQKLAIHQKDKQACIRAAKNHENNFTPDVLKNKTVTPEWLEPAPPAKGNP